MDGARVKIIRGLTWIACLILLAVFVTNPFGLVAHWDSPPWWAGQVAALPGQIAEWWPW